MVRVKVTSVEGEQGSFLCSITYSVLTMELIVFTFRFLFFLALVVTRSLMFMSSLL